MPKIFLTHTPDALKNYYGERAVAGLKAIAEVRFNPKADALTTMELIKAAHDCEVIISYRQTPGDAELFRNSPNLVAFLRCAIDIRNIDVTAASENGILITQASAGFIHSVAEWVISSMIVLGRKIAASAESYHLGKVPPAIMGIQLHGSTLGVIGYGQIGKRVCELGIAFGMKVLVHDPYKKN